MFQLILYSLVLVVFLFTVIDFYNRYNDMRKLNINSTPLETNASIISIKDKCVILRNEDNFTRLKLNGKEYRAEDKIEIYSDYFTVDNKNIKHKFN